MDNNKQYPPQYKSGLAPFRYLELQVTPDVLIPRPETESLVDLALAKICEMSALRQLHAKPEPLRILEIGTGNGAIILSMATELPEKYQIKDTLLVASDISEAALKVARANAVKLGVTDDICFVQDDLAESLCADADFAGYFDIIISNPPYVPSADIANLPPMVKDYEPMLALDGGADGLELWRRIVSQASYLLKTGGGLFAELHEQTVQQATDELSDDFTWCSVEVRPDLAQRPRYISMEKQVELNTLVDEISSGQIGILPTDTVYGLVMAATESADVERFAKLKQRPIQQPLVLLLASAADGIKLIDPEHNYEYLQYFSKNKWPGASTLIVRASEYAQNSYPSFVSHTDKGATLALRVPNSSALQTLIEQLDCPLASSSANRHKQSTPQRFADIDPELLTEADFAYAASTEGAGKASEIFDCTESTPRLIRAKG